jgi:NAD+ kinase
MMNTKVNAYFDLSTGIKLRKRGISIKKFSGDFVITIGGDGTFLRAAHQTNLPILPVKIGGHGFLCTCTFEELKNNLGKLLRGEYIITERLRISCSKIQQKRIEKYINRIRPKFYPHSINEIVFARKRPSKILRIGVKIDNTLFEFSGDGLLIATPAGSSAYNASAGGQLIDPTLKVVSIVPLYPFYSKIKPIIVPHDKKIYVNVKGECAVIIDGHGGEYVTEESDFVVEKGEPIKVLSLNSQNFYDRFKKEFL